MLRRLYCCQEVRSERAKKSGIRIWPAVYEGFRVLSSIRGALHTKTRDRTFFY
jgi:hypothetical protein